MFGVISISFNVTCLGVVLGDIYPIWCFLSFLDLWLWCLTVVWGKFSVIFKYLFHFCFFPFWSSLICMLQFCSCLIVPGCSNIYSVFFFSFSVSEVSTITSWTSVFPQPCSVYKWAHKSILHFFKKNYLFLAVLVIPMFLLLLRPLSHKEGGGEGRHAQHEL